MPESIKLALLATKEVSASSLFGLYDALSGAGQAWEIFVTGETPRPIFDVKIIGGSREPFRSVGGTQICPDIGVDDVSDIDLIVVPGMNVSAIEPLESVEKTSRDWIQDQHNSGTRVVAACSGAVYLAAIGLLDGIEITTHWAYKDLFRKHYPNVQLKLDHNICFESAGKGIVTSGGTTAWQELALFLIKNYGNLEQATRTAKFWLLADRGEFQAPYSSLVTTISHNDAVVRDMQVWAAENYFLESPVNTMISRSGLPASTFSRRFRKATGISPKDYIQDIRVEEAKRRLEMSSLSVDTIGREVGYEDSSSFRRLFKRKTNLTPAKYRKMLGVERFDRYS